MTSIQAQSLPLIIEGKDVIAQGKTGSGKTAAFGLGLLNNLNVKRFRVQSLVLCPTRELADQVAREIRRLARSIHNIKVLTLCGGTPMGPQIGSLEHGAHVIVGTPGRIEDHLKKGRLKLDELNTLVLDEADRMLEMGFQPALDLILSLCPGNRQTLLFSATFPTEIQSITQKVMRTPIRVEASRTHDKAVINQHFYQVKDNQQRLSALKRVLSKDNPESTVIFCNTKVETIEVAQQLKSEGFSVLPLNGDLEQRDRDQTLVRFSNKSISILVATDVAARGLDIDNLDAVINFQIAHDPEVHVHRIGRTGRAGEKGVAHTFISDREVHKIIRLEDYLGFTINTEELPAESSVTSSVTKPTMATLQIDGGKKQKIRPGDILGALTANNEIPGKAVGKIHIFHNHAYVAINRKLTNIAINKLSRDKIKGRNLKVRCLRG